MAYGIVDISVTDGADETSAILVIECYNSFPHDLGSIRNGTSVALKNNGAERTVRLYRERGDECGFPYLELGASTAKALGLKQGTRYQIDYNEMNDTLTFRRVTLSRASVPIDIGTNRSTEPTITIGYSILRMLGFPESKSSYVSVKRGNTVHKLRLIVPENELDEEVRLSPAAAAKLGIPGGQEHLLEYSQSAKVLYLDGATPSESSIAGKRSRNRRPRNGGSAGAAALPQPSLFKRGKSVRTLRLDGKPAPARPSAAPGPKGRRSSRPKGQGAWLSSSLLAPRKR
ncbi:MULTISPECIES: hypothetical protein [Paenibacillus]|uniref:hypothetical protein n=1 Tax=Paenibacillus TaxID=44249 RepID=UPI0022B8DA75|nr:hypothetical protein [Paenibacillus caseinilyticus]MCZ8518983.1 hypothetical protein [Paenibacillus caseinilyticus]